MSVLYIRLPAWLFVVPLALRSRDDVRVGAPNGLPFSRAAPIDRGSIVADSDCQNRPDLGDAQRHRLEWRVSPPA